MALFEEARQKQGRGIGKKSGADRHNRLEAAAWWALLLICALFGGYALYLGGLEIAAQLKLAQSAPERAVPGVFILHALTGGVALTVGPLQFWRTVRAKKLALHRVLGRVYVASVWVASTTGLWSALFFDRGILARVIFVVIAILWFVATTLAYLRARDRRFKAHREWMIRSFALSLFFVTFPLWTDGLTGTPLPAAISYPLGLFLAGGFNLGVAEWWIRAGRGAVSGPSRRRASDRR